MTEVAQYEAWVKELKKKRKGFVSQASMAESMGMTQASLSRILSGKRSGLLVWKRVLEAKGD